MGTCRLIVHGDDFGLSEPINQGIVQAHLRGILTSTSLVASGAAFEDAVTSARSIPSLDVGVHLTLTGEKPVLASPQVPTLVQSDGRMHRDAGAFTSRYLRGLVSLDEVTAELDAQIARVRSQGLAISHLDGHQHLHMLPGVRRCVEGLARKHGIPAVRHPGEQLGRYMLGGAPAPGRLLQLIVLNGFCRLSGRHPSIRTDHFFGFYFGGRLNKENLRTVLDQLPASGTCELMCHPGLDDAGSAYGHWGYSWKAELDALTDTEIAGLIRARAIELASYANLR